MGNQINILKESLSKNIWYEEDYNISPYLTEERGKYLGKSKLLLKPNTTSDVSKILNICNNHKISITTTPQRICITINLLAFYLTIKRMNRRDIYIYPSCQNHFRELSISVATNLILMLLSSH